MANVVEGKHNHDLTICFESAENKQAYHAINVAYPAMDMRASLGNPTDIFIDEG